MIHTISSPAGRAVLICVLVAALMACAGANRKLGGPADPASPLRNLDQAQLIALALNDPVADTAEQATRMLRNDAARLQVAGATSFGTVRRLAIDAVQDITQLEPLARKHRNWRVRVAATERIEDASILAAIATQDASRHVRRVALQRVDSETVLLAAALHEVDPELSRLAVSLLASIQALETVIERATRSEDRVEALERHAGAELALRLLREDHDPELRLAAASWLKADMVEALLLDPDPQLRRWVVMGAPQADLVVKAVDDPDPQVRAAAVARIESPSQLTELAQTAAYADVRSAALIARGDAQTALGAARSDVAAGVRLAAAGLLPKQAVTGLLEDGEADQAVRARLVSRLDDQQLVARFLRDPSAKVRAAAARRLVDPGMAYSLAAVDPDPLVRQAAVSRLIDAEQLTQLLDSERHAEVRRSIAARLPDRARVAMLAGPDEPLLTRLAVAEQLQDPALFARLAEHDASWYLRWRLVPRVADRDVLARIAAHDPHSEVRGRALLALGQSVPTGALLIANAAMLPRALTVGARTDRRALAERLRRALRALPGAEAVRLDVESLLLDTPYALHDEVSGRDSDSGVLWIEHLLLRASTPDRLLVNRKIRAGRTPRAERFEDAQRDASGELVAVRTAQVDAVVFLRDVLLALGVGPAVLQSDDELLAAALEMLAEQN